MNRDLCLYIALFFVVITTSFCEEDFDDELKLKRGASSSAGLFPFPRVGRSDPDMISAYETPLTYSSFENYDDLGRQVMKRQGLVAFPRVGRSGGISPKFLHQLAEFNKRGMSGASPSSSHAWFGPRLGKRANDQGWWNFIFACS